jgi:membrane protein
VLFATTFSIAMKYAAISEIQKTVISHTAPIAISYLVSVIGFFLLYLVLPNAKVHVRPAIWGAAVAALVWTLAKWGFALYVTEFIPYNEIYGVLGLIPLGVFWIFLSWLIVLFGLQLTYTTQHLTTLDEAQIAAEQKREEFFIANDLTVMNIVSEIASGFESGMGPTEAETIASKLDIPEELAEKVLEHLVMTGILVRASEPRDGFMPAKASANMKLSEIAEAISHAGFGQSSDVSVGLRRAADAQREALSQYNVKQILEAEEVKQD